MSACEVKRYSGSQDAYYFTDGLLLESTDKEHLVMLYVSLTANDFYLTWGCSELIGPPMCEQDPEDPAELWVPHHLVRPVPEHDLSHLEQLALLQAVDFNYTNTQTWWPSTICKLLPDGSAWLLLTGGYLGRLGGKFIPCRRCCPGSICMLFHWPPQAASLPPVALACCTNS